VIDELGYLRLDEDGRSLLFEVINATGKVCGVPVAMAPGHSQAPPSPSE
jgi:hypothetical protein